MIPRDLVKKIRRIQIRTTHIVDEMLAGQWHSAFKGRGIEFEEVRPYQVGDDVRTIDWNVTARSDQPFVKLFREERELAVMILVDMSASQGFGTQRQTKRDLANELSATLAFSAIKNNDKVGLTLFTDRIERSFPPRKGTRHVLRLIRETLFHQPVGQGTRLTAALEHLNRTCSRRTVVFLISDFQDTGYERSLRIACRKHDFVPLVISDSRERMIPNVGLIRLRDSETGHITELDTSSRRVRTGFQKIADQAEDTRNDLFRKLGIEPIHFFTGEDFVEPLVKFFRKREKRK